MTGTAVDPTVLKGKLLGAESSGGIGQEGSVPVFNGSSAFRSPEALAALRQAAEDAQADDALTLEDVNPLVPNILPAANGGKDVHTYRRWRQKLKFFGR